jgi:hypothetical protein
VLREESGLTTEQATRVAGIANSVRHRVPDSFWSATSRAKPPRRIGRRGVSGKGFSVEPPVKTLHTTQGDIEEVTTWGHLHACRAELRQRLVNAGRPLNSTMFIAGATVSVADYQRTAWRGWGGGGAS